jgi:hypothetical protein
MYLCDEFMLRRLVDAGRLVWGCEEIVRNGDGWSVGRHVDER